MATKIKLPGLPRLSTHLMLTTARSLPSLAVDGKTRITSTILNCAPVIAGSSSTLRKYTDAGEPLVRKLSAPRTAGGASSTTKPWQALATGETTAVRVAPPTVMIDVPLGTRDAGGKAKQACSAVRAKSSSAALKATAALLVLTVGGLTTLGALTCTGLLKAVPIVGTPAEKSTFTTSSNLSIGSPTPPAVVRGANDVEIGLNVAGSIPKLVNNGVSCTTIDAFCASRFVAAVPRSAARWAFVAALSPSCGTNASGSLLGANIAAIAVVNGVTLATDEPPAAGRLRTMETIGARRPAGSIATMTYGAAADVSKSQLYAPALVAVTAAGVPAAFAHALLPDESVI